MRSFLTLVLDIYLNLYVNFLFNSAGINSSPDSSHFVRYHADNRELKNHDDDSVDDDRK